MSFKVDLENQQEYAEKEIARRKAETGEADDAKYDAQREALSKATQISDSDLLDDIIALGFDSETVGVLPLVPLIAVAWADGSVSGREASRILDLAEKRGVGKATPAYQRMDELLNQEPTSEYLHACIYVLRGIYDALEPGETKRAKRNLLGFTYVVAKASGGVLGLFGNKICDEERSLIEGIADWLGVTKSATSHSVHQLVAVDAPQDSAPAEDGETAEADEENPEDDAPSKEEASKDDETEGDETEGDAKA